MAPRQRPFVQVDVFTKVPYKGNALAVIQDATDITSEDMAAFARWTNLAETTFLLPPTDRSVADYKVRIFTPEEELPFAGHPSLGSCEAWLQHGGKPRNADYIVQECGIGLVKIRREASGKLALRAPPLKRSGPVEEEALKIACKAMNIPRKAVIAHQWIENGPPWFGIELGSAQEVLDVKPTALAGPSTFWGIVGKYPNLNEASTEENPLLEVRAFILSGGSIIEDPVTGSLK